MSEEERRIRVTDAAEKLTRLLDDPHPGLYSWNQACERTYQEILNAARA